MTFTAIAASGIEAHNLFRQHRGVLVTAVYLGSIALSNYLAFWFRFDGAIPPQELLLWRMMLPWLLALHWVVFVPLGLHRSVWRFTGIWDLRDLMVAVGVSSVAFSVLVHMLLRQTAYPRSVFILGPVLSVSIIGGLKLAWRIALENQGQGNRRRVLLFGAGNAGEMIVRDLIKKGCVPVGFVDDDPAKLWRSIHRVRVLGNREDLPRLITTERADEVLIAMPSAPPAAIRRIVSALEPFKVAITTVPPLREIVDGTVTMNEVRQLAVEDLLPRMPVQLDTASVRHLIEGRRVMVTGAGGSIGSELSRQILALNPEKLILFERYENNLYTVLNTIGDSPRAVAAVGDVTDLRRLHAVFRGERPDVVFHAAAHKHVPLMELNPCEAVKNNVIGTRRVAEAAVQYGVDRFILISTDKAVNPSSLMGATKRVAELVVQALASPTGPRLVTVRFGNVLGSNGSVIPRWIEQIGAGGPVTVTHPEVRRYFMLIPEAVQLILQAAAVTRGGEIFVLEMGDQIALIDVARNLIRLSGFVPDEEIPISITGLRPGEKLAEELVGPEERVEASPVDKVLQLRTIAQAEPPALLSAVARLGALAVQGNTPAVIEILCRIVPTFQPGPQLHAQATARATASRTLRTNTSGRRVRRLDPRHSSSHRFATAAVRASK